MCGRNAMGEGYRGQDTRCGDGVDCEGGERGSGGKGGRGARVFIDKPQATLRLQRSLFQRARQIRLDEGVGAEKVAECVGCGSEVALAHEEYTDAEERVCSDDVERGNRVGAAAAAEEAGGEAELLAGDEKTHRRLSEFEEAERFATGDEERLEGSRDVGRRGGVAVVEDGGGGEEALKCG
jgi:hypothetical protein